VAGIRVMILGLPGTLLKLDNKQKMNRYIYSGTDWKERK